MAFDNKKPTFLTVVFFVFLFSGTEVLAAACNDYNISPPTESLSGCTVSIRYEDMGGSELAECKYQVVSPGSCPGNTSWDNTAQPSASCSGLGPVDLSGTVSVPAGIYDVCWYSKDKAWNENQGKKMTVKIGSAADFSLSPPPSPNTIRVPKTGVSQSSAITVTSLSGFNSPVTLSVISGLPTGAASIFSSNPVTPPADGSITSNFSINTSNVVPGSYVLTIQGQGGNPILTRTATLNLVVFDLSVALSASPSSGSPPLNGVALTATVSGSAIGTINYKFDCTSNGSWDYTFNGISDNPKTVVNACDYASAGTYTAKVRVERDWNGSAEATAVITVTVACTGTLTVPISGTGTCTVTASLTASNCDGQTWEIRDSETRKCPTTGLGTVSGNPYSNTCPWTVSTGSYTYNLYIGGVLKDSKSVTCSATPFDFFISINPTSGSTSQGSSVSATVSTTLTSGTAQSVSFSVTSGLPSGASVFFSPISCNPSCSSAMTIGTTASTPVGGPYSINVRGTGGGKTYDITYALTVTASTVVISQPSVTTNSATIITQTSAALNGTLNGMGNAASVLVWFEWGPTVSYGNSTSVQTMTAVGAFSANISSLNPNTTYYFKARAKNGGSW